MDIVKLVDPELAPLLSLFPAITLNATTLPDMRAQVPGMEPARDGADDGLPLMVNKRLIPGTAGQPDVRVVIVTPGNTGQRRTGILHMHGGGYVMGTPEQSLPMLRATAHELDAVIVSVDYRLAPETPYPGPLEDCYAALFWMVSQAAALGVDPTRIGAVGESAGGGLAAALALLARDRGGPALAYQCLMYPMLDDRTVVDPDPNPVIGDFVWDRSSNAFAWRALLGREPGGEGIPGYAAPGRATNLAGLPPTYIAVGALDLFVDEDIAYATRLLRAGVAVELQVYPGAFHGFDGAMGAEIALRARRQRMDALRRMSSARGS